MLSFTFSCYTDAKQVAKNTYEIQNIKVKYIRPKLLCEQPRFYAIRSSPVKKSRTVEKLTL